MTLERIERRLTSCNVDAGMNFISTEALQAAYGIIDNLLRPKVQGE